MTLKVSRTISEKNEAPRYGIELAISVPGIWPVLKKRIHGFEHKVA
jgi:hypothetical protein